MGPVVSDDDEPRIRGGGATNMKRRGQTCEEGVAKILRMMDERIKERQKQVIERTNEDTEKTNN